MLKVWPETPIGGMKWSWGNALDSCPDHNSTTGAAHWDTAASEQQSQAYKGQWEGLNRPRSCRDFPPGCRLSSLLLWDGLYNPKCCMRKNRLDSKWDESQRQTRGGFKTDPRSAHQVCKADLYPSSTLACLTLQTRPTCSQCQEPRAIHHGQRPMCEAHTLSSSRDHSVGLPSIAGVTGFLPLLGWVALHFFVKMIDLQSQNLLWCAVVQSEQTPCRYSKQEEEESSINKYGDDDRPKQLCSGKIRGQTSTVTLFQRALTRCFRSWHNSICQTEWCTFRNNKPMCRELLYRL